MRSSLPSNERSVPLGGRAVVVLGEVLCDIFSLRPGVSLAESPHFLPSLGGAPANVAVQLARLGCSVELVTAVGKDPLGDRVLRRLAAEGVQVGHVAIRPERRTGVTLVEVDAAGERRFFPFGEGRADLSLELEDVPLDAVRRSVCLHHGTVTFRSPSATRATRAAVRAARKAGVIVSVDVNLRHRMFPSLERLFSLARGAMRRADIVKATVEEARALFGALKPAALLQQIHRCGPSLVALTKDAEGALLSTPDTLVSVPSPSVELVDATGAGDAFMGALLAAALEIADAPAALAALTETELQSIATMACDAGAQAVTALGATTAMGRRVKVPSG